MGEKIASIRISTWEGGISRIIFKTSNGRTLYTPGAILTKCGKPNEVTINTALYNIVGFGAGLSYATVDWRVSNFVIMI
jgi:hypothetical protein